MTVSLFQKIDSMRHAGVLDPKLAAARQMRVVESQLELAAEGIIAKLYWLVDLEDGVIVDARYQLFGPSLLLGLLEIACEWVILKSYDQAKRTSAVLLEKQIREPHPLPKAANRYLNLILDLFEHAALQCSDIPLPEELTTPLAAPIEIVEGGYPGWQTLSTDQQLALIEEVLKTEIRPFVEMDGGGVDVVKIVGNQVTIIYHGACTTCFSSTGATLSFIQQMLAAKLWPELIVIPDLPK